MGVSELMHDDGPTVTGHGTAVAIHGTFASEATVLSLSLAQSEVVRVRITRKPTEREVDGVNLDRLAPGAVRNVSTSIASWLIAEGYAEPEMRNRSRDDDLRPSNLFDEKIRF